MGEGRDQMSGSLELFNSSKKMTRQGRYVQQGLVPSSIANSHSPPMSQLHTHRTDPQTHRLDCFLKFPELSVRQVLRTVT